MDAADYEQLAEKDPNRLTLIVESRGAEGVEWEMACEIAGQLLSTTKIQGPLVRQLQKATNASEFDAVMGGLSYHLDSTAKAVLQRLLDKSDNPAIRACAEEALEQDQYAEESDDDEPGEEDMLDEG